MNIQILSDAHAEFHRDGGTSFVESLDPEGVDVLVVAGDVGLVKYGTTQTFLRMLCKRYPHVVFVLGNHEYYGGTIAGTLNGMAALNEEIPNLHWLENDTVTIEGQRFLGTTLWFPQASDGLNSIYAGRLNDFHKIGGGFAQWVYEANHKAMDYLKENVQEGDVVVTHHIPTQEGVLPKWRTSPLNRFFLCQMPQHILGTPKLWAFGHTHDSMSFTLGDCRFVCNPFGYVGVEQNPSYQEKLVVTV